MTVAEMLRQRAQAHGGDALPTKMRAWKIYVQGWGSEPQAVSIAASRSKAQARSYGTARDVGYSLKWGDFRVVRAPEFDSWFETYGMFAWSWEHVQKMAANHKADATPPAAASD